MTIVTIYTHTVFVHDNFGCLYLFIDPAVQFILGVADVQVKICTPAELSCKLSSPNCKGVWYKDGFQVSAVFFNDTNKVFSNLLLQPDNI